MKFSIHYKITFIFALIFAAVLAGITIYLNQNHSYHTFNRISEHLRKELLLARAYVQESLDEEQLPFYADEITDRIGDLLGSRVTIVDMNGKVIGDSDLDGKELLEVENHLYRPEIQSALKNGFGQSRRFSTTVKKDMLYMAMPIDETKNLGIVRLSIPLSNISLISSELNSMLFISVGIAFVFALFISYLVSFIISRPLKQMALIATNVAHGNYNKRADDTSNDELGDLARAINQTIEQFKNRIEEITSNKTKFEAVLLSMFDGVMVVNDQGQIVLVNETIRNIIEIGEHPEGKQTMEIIRNIELQSLVKRVLNQKSEMESIELSLNSPTERTIIVHATPVVRNNDVDGAVLVFHDITELRKLEKVRQDFVANVSHELRTPVTSIKGYAETLLDGAINDEKNAQEFLKIITTDSDRLAKLINDLLDLSKIESGKIELTRQMLDLRPIVESVLAGLKNQIKSKSITIENELSETLPKVNIDEQNISQVFLNLIENAIKYNKENGTIKISAKDMGDMVQVEVADSGIGIPTEDLPRIFERFYRVDKARSRELGGTGLGLSIVKHIIQSHLGEVFVKSTVGQGSKFYFTLPKS